MCSYIFNTYAIPVFFPDRKILFFYCSNQHQGLYHWLRFEYQDCKYNLDKIKVLFCRQSTHSKLLSMSIVGRDELKHIIPLHVQIIPCNFIGYSQQRGSIMWMLWLWSLGWGQIEIMKARSNSSLELQCPHSFLGLTQTPG